MIEVFQILTCQQHGGFFFTNTLEAISDVLDSSWVGEPDVQLIQCRHRVSFSQELVRQIGEYIEQHGVTNIFRCAQQSFDTEHQESAGRDVSMTVEELRVRALAHGVQPKQDFLKKILRVELMRFGMIVFELIFDQVIEIRESRIILCSHPDKVAPIRDAPFLIQL